jgi:hypothetical protein
VPRELWVEASGEMSSFDQAIVDLTNASAMVLPAIAFCANAPIEEPEPEMAYELRVGESEHKLYQRHITPEFGFPRARRRAPTAAITPFMQKWLAHPDAERIYGRSCNMPWPCGMVWRAGRCSRTRISTWRSRR